MKVLKFGGTSVGKPERMHSIAQLIDQPEPLVVVLSALSGTTNALVAIGNALEHQDKQAATHKTDELYKHYQHFIAMLYTTAEGKQHGETIINEHFNTIRRVIQQGHYSATEERILLAQGELLSTRMFHAYLQEQGRDAALLPALSFMKIDSDNEPSLSFIEENLANEIQKAGQHRLYITQGYICRNAFGEIDNLKRGGSDYSASLIGAALRSSEIQIWTDIDGMHNNDPRIVRRTFPIAELTFDEAAELAYFGAKILHPSSVWPAQKFSIPVRLLNTMQPEAKGTTILNTSSYDKPVKAIAAKDGLTAIKIKSSRMLLAYGFLNKVFGVFERYKTPVDVITTSEVAVSVTIDNASKLSAIIQELKAFGTVETDQDLSIICIVGNIGSSNQVVISQVFKALDGVPVRMVSFGGSEHNISIVIPSAFRNQALEQLNEALFDWE